MARAEAKASFDNSDVYIEKFCENPRHVEVQLIGDSHGNVIHLGERDCSVQRRHQKPMEFLLDKQGNFYFMEMNTRVQVEHPVTEMITGVDIIKEQIRVAYGEPLRYQQKDIKINGHAIECRINAEDPVKFTPCPGKIDGYHPPGGLGVRIDSAVYDQYTVLPHYDSMIAKLIVHADTREEAIKRMARSLDEFIIGGIKTTIEFHQRIMNNKDFIEGDIDTGFLERLKL